MNNLNYLITEDSNAALLNIIASIMAIFM